MSTDITICIESKIKIILMLNEKVNYKTVIECGKRCQNIFIGLKKTCLGVLDRGDRDKTTKQD